MSESSISALVLPSDVMGSVLQRLVDAYPREGCGVLMGRVQGDSRIVTDHRPAANRWPGRQDRYLVDPDLVHEAIREEEAGGLQVLGFYHSHPDSAPVPSATDLELAWPWYHYLIVATGEDSAGEARVWQLDQGGEEFLERRLHLTSEEEN